ncbi:MAG: PKD domain-containing protein [Thermoanaerobaculales bacterium]|nr:PKD domain-containing protein [Thermoanaerobaculales bacterium]
MRGIFVIITVFGVMLSGAAQVGADCADRVGHWGYGPTQGVVIAGELAVFGSGTVLQVADISNPSVPRVIGELQMAGVVLGMAAMEEVVFVGTSEGGLAVVDISVPADPVLMALEEDPDWVIDVTVSGSTLFVAGRRDGLVIFDATDPANLVEMSRFETEGKVWDVAVAGDLAFVGNFNEGLQIVDISDLEHPELVATLDEVGTVSGVDVSGDFAYIADWYEGMWVVDISDSENPEAVEFIDVYNYALDVRVAGGYVYLANRVNGLSIFDISDPAAPVEVASVDREGETQRIDILGNLAVLANYSGGLRVVDISVPEEAEEIGFIQGKTESNDVAIKGNLALIPGGGWLKFLDIANPARPREVATLDLPGYSREAEIVDDFAFVAGGSGGLHVLDIGDPQDPILVGTAEVPNALSVDVVGNMAYVGCGSDGLRVVDVSDPEAPDIVGALEGLYVENATYVNGTVYIGEYNVGIHIIDVTLPSAPLEVALLNVEKPMEMVAQGEVAFIGEASNGVWIFDASNPFSPVELGRYPYTFYPFGIYPAGELLAIADIYDGFHVIDVSDLSNPTQVAVSPFIGTAEAGIDGDGALVVVARREGGIEIFDLLECFSEAPTADFNWTPTMPETGGFVQFSDTTVGTVDSWSWDFGDGFVSTLRNPMHIWSVAGDYIVTLTVNGSFGSDSISKTIGITDWTGEVPPITSPGAYTYVIPAAAHVAGQEDTNWITDSVMHNLGDETAGMFLYFMKAGQNNMSTVGVRQTVASGASLMITDVVLSIFGEDDAAGAILIGSNQPLLVTSRTFNDASSGTFGQFIPGLELDQGVEQGEAVRLIQLTRSDDFRTNIGFANATGKSLTVGVELVASNGAALGTRSYTISPYGYFQKTDIFGADVDEAMAIVSSTTSDAQYFTYASVVDNRTGDGVLVQPAVGAAELLVAAAAHVGGIADTKWSTDLELHNPGGEEVDCTIEFLESGQANSTPRSETYPLGAGLSRRFIDVVAEVFSFEGSGALRVSVASEEIMVTSRTFNTIKKGTYGQFLAGNPIDEAISFGQEARIVQLAQDPTDTEGFRTNVGFVNMGSSAIDVNCELYRGNGTFLDTVTTRLQPYEHDQISRIFHQATVDEISNGFVVLKTSDPGGSFVAYASVIDNRSGDPIYIPALVID